MNSKIPLRSPLTITLLGVFSILIASCSSSNNEPSEPSSDDNNPFTNPDPDGTTVIARLAYPAVRDLADDLVSMSYISQYYELDPTISRLLQSGDRMSDVTVDCPEGGIASGTLSIFDFDVVFTNCVVDNRILNGGLARDASFIVFGLGDSQEVSVRFNNLIIDAGIAGSIELTGVSTRNDGNFAITECSGSPAKTLSVTNQIDSARIWQSDVQTTISTASWQQSRVTRPQQPKGDPFGECLVVEHLTFDGETMATSPEFDGNTATIKKRGDILRGTSAITESTATLISDFGDSSSLALTATSDSEREVQVDIISDGTVVSFVSDYRFEARPDIPPILGERP